MTASTAPAFAPALKRLRARAGLSQSQLAERAGVPVSTLRGLEQGSRDNPSWQTITALSAALGASLGDWHPPPPV